MAIHDLVDVPAHRRHALDLGQTIARSFKDLQQAFEALFSDRNHTVQHSLQTGPHDGKRIAKIVAHFGYSRHSLRFANSLRFEQCDEPQRLRIFTIGEKGVRFFEFAVAGQFESTRQPFIERFAVSFVLCHSTPQAERLMLDSFSNPATDIALAAAIDAELRRDFSIPLEVTVGVSHAVVTLGGTVDTAAQSEAAELCVRRFREITGVINTISILSQDSGSSGA